MSPHVVRAGLVVAFASALGHLAWHTWFGRALVPDYMVGGKVCALCGPNRDARQLYVRREICLSQRPRHAWLQVLGRDRLRLYVNGRFLAQQSLPGFPVAVLADLTPYLQIGQNIIAIVAEQASLGKPPVIAVDGAYAFEEQEYPLCTDDQWRCSS